MKMCPKNVYVFISFISLVSLCCKQLIQEDKSENHISLFTVHEFREGELWLYKVDRDITSPLWVKKFKNYESDRFVRSDGHAGDGYYFRVVVTSSGRNSILLSFTNSGGFIVEEDMRIQSGTPSAPEVFEPIGSNMRFKRDGELSELARMTLEEIERK